MHDEIIMLEDDTAWFVVNADGSLSITLGNGCCRLQVEVVDVVRLKDALNQKHAILGLNEK